MTLNRYLILFALLIGSTIAFLSFAPPQTGKWVYMWQAYILVDDDVIEPLISIRVPLTPKEDAELFIPLGTLKVSESYSGTWRFWNDNGTLISVSEFTNGALTGMQFEYKDELLVKMVVNGLKERKLIFDFSKSIDRRKEFGIPIE